MDSKGDLEGRRVLVAGATGGIGEGMTAALRTRGATVLAAGRSAERLDRLVETLGGDGVIPVPVDLTGDPAAVRRELAEHGVTEVDGTVVTIGDWGPPERVGLLDVDDATWDHMIAANLTAHFRTLRSITPLVARTGALIHLSGFSAEIPYPFAALVGATNAAKKSLLRSLTAELGGRGPRVYELVIGPIRTRPRAAAGVDDPRWYSAEQLGEHAADLVAGTGKHVGDPLQYLVMPGAGITTTLPRT